MFVTKRKSAHTTLSSTLIKKVKRLPELYQPLYGHPNYTTSTSRHCTDRLSYIITAYHSLAQQMQRPIRVLDLGCAQGFFSLELAALGANVTGIDFLPENIEVCKALAKEHPEFNIFFQTAQVEEIIHALPTDEFDLVLGLSVFHHIIHAHGIISTQQLLQQLAKKVRAGIFEMALASEPTHWHDSQPNDPCILLKDFAFVHTLAHHVTHLSNIQRPLYFASNHYWLLGKQCGKFTSWKDTPYTPANFAHGGTRRYYSSPQHFIKFYQLKNDYPNNLKEFEREIAFLSAPPQGLPTPTLLLSGKNTTEAWLVREKIVGDILLDMIYNNAPYDARRIVEDILQQCCLLEQHGLYHNDIRSWNVIITPTGNAVLIDHGSITNQSRDCTFKQDNLHSFLLFCRETINREIDSSLTHLSEKDMQAEDFPAEWRPWVSDCLAMATADKSFANIAQELQKIAPSTYVRLSGTQHSTPKPQVEKNTHTQQLITEIGELQQRNYALKQQIYAIEHSLSWRLTKPLRNFMHILRSFFKKQ